MDWIKPSKYTYGWMEVRHKQEINEAIHTLLLDIK